MAGQTQPSMDQFEAYFRRADLDRDGRISGNEAITFFQGSNLPRQILAQIWTIADHNRTGFLGRQEFYNALKLVTVAQSNRPLTDDIVKLALYGPASAKIPAPQINLTPTPNHQSNVTVGSSVPPPTAATMTTPQAFGVRGPQDFASQPDQVMRSPRPPNPSPSLQSVQGFASPAMPSHGGNKAVSYPPNSSAWPGGNSVTQPGVNSQTNINMRPFTQDGLTMAVSGLPHSTQPGVQGVSQLTQPVSSKPSGTSVGGQVEAKDSKALAVAGNGHASDSLFGDVFSVSSVQTKQDTAKVTSPASNLPVSAATVPASLGMQSTAKSSPLDSLQISPTQRPMGGQQGHFPVKSSQQSSMQASSSLPTGSRNHAAGPPQVAWPRMTQSDVQKYSNIFMQVDTDRDGRITGQQARNLFLSWKTIPQDVLKQVWDLSDQDNDSMLSLREFCVALYLMEQYKKGRPLPAALPSNIMLDESLLAISGQPAVPHGNTVLRATPGYQQPQVMKVPRGVASAAVGKPPRPVPVPQPEDSMQPNRQKPKIPMLEKDLLNQLSTEEQSSLNSKLQEATDAEKKVAELEKEISDAREKIQFFHSKMQELVLYKSRCDNRLNEISERVSVDKREVESLAKKYEEKYRQAGDVASKLTIEEATFRDIQEKKMDMYRAIVKLEQDGGADGIQERADRIQLDLEELVKSLNERCKTYGLRAKPTLLVELPFGWQPGIQEGAADWDENWDKFEDEGFTFVKELTLDVQNVVAPTKPKSSLVQEKETSIHENGVAKSSSDAYTKAEKVQRTGERISEDEIANTPSEEQTVHSPPESPARSNAPESGSRGFEDSLSKKDITFDGSPHATQSEHGGAESYFSGDKGFDEPGLGKFDMTYDADAPWDFNRITTKEADSERQNDSFPFGLNPIRTGSTQRDNAYPKQGPFFDSFPSTPMSVYNSGNSPPADNMSHRKSPFFDSVPSTPVSVYNSGSSPHADNNYMLPKQSLSAFADSVPSTPMYLPGSSPRRFGEASEDRSFDSFSRFDSFNMNDSGLFTPRDSSFSRFDSMRSTRDSEYDNGPFGPRDSLARFDSFRSTADSDYNFGVFPPPDSLTRFDSIRSTRDSEYGHGFSSFDEPDPFASNDPFRTSMESQTPRRDSGSWKAF